MRADRLISLMLLLNSRGRMTAGDLSRHLEVSERTVYRDIDALNYAGVPIYTQPGTNGGIFLDENYRVSLTGLTRPEALSLFVSSEVGPLKDLGFARAVEDTLVKLFATLPTGHRVEVERMRQRFYIDPGNWFQESEPLPFFPQLQQAVWEDRQVEVIYQHSDRSPFAGLIEAHALVAKANVWYLIAREPEGAMRMYRVSRFSDVRLTDSIFERQPDFNLPLYWKEACRDFEREVSDTLPSFIANEITLHVRTDAIWFFKTIMPDDYKIIGRVPRPGWELVKVSCDSTEQARILSLGLGDRIEVVEPAELRDWVINSAQAVLRANEQWEQERALPLRTPGAGIV